MSKESERLKNDNEKLRIDLETAFIVLKGVEDAIDQAKPAPPDLVRLYGFVKSWRTEIERRQAPTNGKEPKG